MIADWPLMCEKTESAPTNRKALVSISAAGAAAFCFCGGVVPVPLTALICFPLTGILGLIALIAGIAGLHELRSRQENGRNLALTGAALGSAVSLATLCMTIVGIALIQQIIDAIGRLAHAARMQQWSGLPIPQHSIMLVMGLVRSRWASWSSKPVAGRVASRGGFDSHPLPQVLCRWIQHKLASGDCRANQPGSPPTIHSTITTRSGRQ